MKTPKYTTFSGFTLIELIVSITIFSIIMISVISVFLFSSDMSGKIEINRILQENIKNAVETIAEDVRKNGLEGVSESSSSPNCNPFSGGVDDGDKLCTTTSQYFVAKYNDVLSDWIRVDPASECQNIADVCTLVQNNGISKSPLTNSFITFRDVRFYVSGDEIPKLTLTFRVQPAAKKGVRPDIIQANELFFQTTLSERIIDLR